MFLKWHSLTLGRLWFQNWNLTMPVTTSHKTVILVKPGHNLWRKIPSGFTSDVLRLLCLNSLIHGGSWKHQSLLVYCSCSYIMQQCSFLSLFPSRSFSDSLIHTTSSALCPEVLCNNKTIFINQSQGKDDCLAYTLMQNEDSQCRSCQTLAEE